MQPIQPTRVQLTFSSFSSSVQTSLPGLPSYCISLSVIRSWTLHSESLAIMLHIIVQICLSSTLYKSLRFHMRVSATSRVDFAGDSSGPATTSLTANTAEGSGGAVMASGCAAELHIEAGHRLLITSNIARVDGGGLGFDKVLTSYYPTPRRFLSNRSNPSKSVHNRPLLGLSP